MLIPVAIGAVLHDNKILLIKRTNGDYIGYWSLPGGKVEEHEHVSSAAIREIKEESGIDTQFIEYLGTISELLYEKDSVKMHFLLHLIHLHPHSFDILHDKNLAWFDLDRIDESHEMIIPSDLEMIRRIVKARESKYFDCVVEKIDNIYLLKGFDPLT